MNDDVAFNGLLTTSDNGTLIWTNTTNQFTVSGNPHYHTSYNNPWTAPTLDPTKYYVYNANVFTCGNIDFKGERLETGDKIIYSYGKKGELKEGTIIGFTNKCIMLDNGNRLLSKNTERIYKL